MRQVLRFIATIVLTATLGCDSPEAPGRSEVLDLTGQIVDPLEPSDNRATVLVFTRTDCPISNRFAPEIRRLYETYSTQAVGFYMVYVDPDQSAAAIGRHFEEYAYPCEGLFDPEHLLVGLTKASVTPEAAVLAPRTAGGRHDQLVYRGRINNWYVDFGKARAAPTQHDLADALDAVLDGRPVSNATTEAVGCYIADLK